ncbi:hypothetical protein [Desulfosporosinus sp. BICA1-9]|uniref:hypothetical protein n=1 Tax=Desulfosporosinus sp. BICA1-9 TaxID=1531958 RepID=UPI00054B7CE0|nr:hypothetical protein [Desulfosporosinus sp. BICA1-9]KJS50476.1 MAG: hypothetical protein VR66_02595 [Peptococcaceae bacterium BRH_c23]KJS85374.1 MAG: hypothetical protein JL57_19155 [Desulfosporosinus sp. BICA1-9]HBW36856.1 hypothetical protein [Desulfosporosinus sp.]
MTEMNVEKLGKISFKLSCAVLVLSVLFFWISLNLLKSEVFTHYYDPSKHVIVSQNHDTKELYSWKDVNGNVYTPEDPQVANFTWGSTGMLLVTMLLGIGLQKAGICCSKILMMRNKTVSFHINRGGE